MAITPQTDLMLIKSPLELDNLNQLTFSSASVQATYFASLPHLRVTDFTYQRKDNVIRYPAHIDSLYEYNYVMYRNNHYSSKYFYAFITRMEYINDNMTNIYIKTDTFQTWQFDLQYKESFVEREHVNDDSLGTHTVPEGIATGDYVCNSKRVLYEGDSNTTLCVMVSDMPDEISNLLPIKLGTYNGIFSGCRFMIFDPTNPELSASNFLRAMDVTDMADAVVSIFIIPNSLIPSSITYTTFDVTVTHGIRTQHIEFKGAMLPSSTGAVVMATSSDFSSPTTLNGYTPKNNKCRVYPYSYFYVSNNVGADVEFHYEDFYNSTASFKTIGAITPGCSIRCVPLNYKKLTDTSTSLNSFNAGIPVGKYPTCAWKTDLYTNWQTENQINQFMGYGAGIVGIGAGAALIATGAGAGVGIGAIAGGITSIIGAINQDYQHSLIPDHAKGNTNTGDVTFSSGNLDVIAYKMSVRNEFAKIIDDFFSAFGYKINTYKIPNITGRRNWNYVKCDGINITGDIPQEDMQEIKSLFNNGITLWHNTSTFLDYSQNNDII